MTDSRYIPRALDVAALSRRKSLFLFGPRQTGKTALIRHALPSAKVYDLLDGDVFRTLSHRPARLGEELESGDRLVVVDEPGFGGVVPHQQVPAHVDARPEPAPVREPRRLW